MRDHHRRTIVIIRVRIVMHPPVQRRARRHRPSREKMAEHHEGNPLFPSS